MEDMDNEEQGSHIGDDKEDRFKLNRNKWNLIANNSISKFNNEQSYALNEVLNSLESDEIKEKIFFLTGDGGTGKSFLYNALIAKCRALDYGVIPCASTGIASILLKCSEGTAHRAFRIPNEILSNHTCQFSYTDPKAVKLKNSKLIIIDEVSMLHKNVIKAIDSTLRYLYLADSQERKTAFAGKTIYFWWRLETTFTCCSTCFC